MAKVISHAELARYLTCVINDCAVLARATRELTRSKDVALSEIYKTVGAVKLRAVYDFLHRPGASDTIKHQMFKVYDPTVPAANSFKWDAWLNHESINCYFLHLDRRRVDKIIPQPKFEGGKAGIVRNTIKLLDQAFNFIESVLNHRDFSGLGKYGKKYWKSFRDTLYALHR